MYYFLLLLQMVEFAQAARAAKVHNEIENYTKNGRNYAREKLVLPLAKGSLKFLQWRYPYLGILLVISCLQKPLSH